MTVPVDEEAGEWLAPSIEVPEGSNVLYVAAHSGTHPDADGSEEAPFTSLASAVQVFRSLVFSRFEPSQYGDFYHEHPYCVSQASRSLSNPSTILLREGTHFLDATIHLGSQDSGLTIQNAPGEKAVVSGGKPLQTAWKPSAVCDGCYEASLSGQTTTLAGLRRNDVREIRARYPNFDPELGSVIDGVQHVHDGRDGWITAKTNWVAEGQVLVVQSA